MEMRGTFYSGLDLETSLEPDHGLNHHYPKPLATSSPNTLSPYLYSNFSKDLTSQEVMNPLMENVASNVSKIGRALALNSSSAFNSSLNDPPGEYVESITMEEIVSVVVPIIFGLIVIVGLFGQ